MNAAYKLGRLELAYEVWIAAPRHAEGLPVGVPVPTLGLCCIANFPHYDEPGYRQGHGKFGPVFQATSIQRQTEPRAGLVTPRLSAAFLPSEWRRWR